MKIRSNGLIYKSGMQAQTKSTKKSILSSLTFIIDFIILLASGIIAIFFVNEASVLQYIGILIVMISIYLCFKVRENRKLVFLFAIIGFINISLGVSDLINKGLYVADWQLALRSTEYNVYTAKSVLIFLSIVNIMLTKSWLKTRSINKIFAETRRNENPIIAFIGISSLFVILILGYGSDLRNSSNYVSNNNPLYEYAIVIYLVSWMFSGKNKIFNVLLVIYAVLYSMYSFYFGDRSAAFLMILMFFFLHFEQKISIVKLMSLSVIAIIIANFIAGYRIGGSLDIASIIEYMKEKGLYSDTVSYSYYTGITLTKLHHIDSNAPTYFLGYLKSLVLGSGSSEYSSMDTFIRGKYSELFNRGGGLYTSAFYSWFGYLGVSMSAVAVGLIVRLVYSRPGAYAQLYQVLVIVFSIRWYLYNPTTLFRGIFFISTILLFICIEFDKLTRKQVIEKKSI